MIASRKTRAVCCLKLTRYTLTFCNFLFMMFLKFWISCEFCYLVNSLLVIAACQSMQRHTKAALGKIQVWRLNFPNCGLGVPGVILMVSAIKKPKIWLRTPTAISWTFMCQFIWQGTIKELAEQSSYAACITWNYICMVFHPNFWPVPIAF